MNPKVVEVPGMGNVEFPGDMSDDAISAAIKANMAQAPQGLDAVRSKLAAVVAKYPKGEEVLPWNQPKKPRYANTFTPDNAAPVTGFENYEAPPITPLAVGAAKSVPALTGGLTGFEQGSRGLSSGDEMTNAMTSAEAPQGLQEKAGQIMGVAAQMAPAIGGMAELSQLIPSASRAGRALGQVKQVAGEVPVNVNEAGDVALRIKDLADRGASMPKVIRNFLSRVTDPEGAPVTFAEARDFYSNASKLSAAEGQRMIPAVRREVALFTQALGRSITETAASVGQGGKFTGAMTEYARAQKAKDVASWLLTKGLPTAMAGYAAEKIAKKLF